MVEAGQKLFSSLPSPEDSGGASNVKTLPAFLSQYLRMRLSLRMRHGRVVSASLISIEGMDSTFPSSERK